MNQFRLYRPVTYTSVNNEPLREFRDLQAIGMLSYLCSHIDGFEITKTFLHKRFGRAAATNGLKVLEEEGYLLSFKVRKGSKNGHEYFVSDVKFDAETVLFLTEKMNKEEDITRVVTVNGRFAYLFDQKEDESSSVENQQLNKSHDTNDSSIVENQQLNMNSGNSTAQIVHQKKTKDLKNKNLKKTSSEKTKTKTSSSPAQVNGKEVSRETIRHELIALHGLAAVDLVEQALTNDPKVDIRTDRQYAALMSYRLKNLRQPKPSQGINPSWIAEEREKQAKYEAEQKAKLAQEAESMTEEELQEILENLS